MFKSETIIDVVNHGGAELVYFLLGMRNACVTTKMKTKDLQEKGRYGARVVKKFMKRHPEVMDANKAVVLLDCLTDLSQNEDNVPLDGLGGSQVVSVESILRKHNLIGDQNVIT